MKCGVVLSALLATGAARDFVPCLTLEQGSVCTQEAAPNVVNTMTGLKNGNLVELSGDATVVFTRPAAELDGGNAGWINAQFVSTSADATLTLDLSAFEVSDHVVFAGSIMVPHVVVKGGNSMSRPSGRAAAWRTWTCRALSSRTRTVRPSPRRQDFGSPVSSPWSICRRTVP